MEQKSNRSEFAHTEELSGDGSQWTTDLSRNSGTYIVYNSHVTCSNYSFSLTMVTPTSHFFAFHWLYCLLPIGYLPKPGSVGIRICHYHRISTTPIVQVIFQYLRPDAPVFNIHRIHNICRMVIFRQSPCWYYPWADVAVSTSSDTQHLWTWWHFGDHTGLLNLSVNNIRLIHTCRSR